MEPRLCAASGPSVYWAVNTAGLGKAIWRFEIRNTSLRILYCAPTDVELAEQPSSCWQRQKTHLPCSKVRSWAARTSCHMRYKAVFEVSHLTLSTAADHQLEHCPPQRLHTRITKTLPLASFKLKSASRVPFCRPLILKARSTHCDLALTTWDQPVE